VISPMNIDKMLQSLNASETDFLVIGGVNFMFRHSPELTFDLDIWVRDNDNNLVRLNTALRELGAEWGQTDETWGPVPESARWLKSQGVYCLITREGALDVFREVRGLEGQYDQCAKAAYDARTKGGLLYRGLSDEHMLQTQLVLPPGEQKPARIAALRKALGL
jgi:hypothetical protein